jgi:multidrug efflux pump subunit AcrA (membrane-fusion protein)
VGMSLSEPTAGQAVKPHAARDSRPTRGLWRIAALLGLFLALGVGGATWWKTREQRLQERPVAAVPADPGPGPGGQEPRAPEGTVHLSVTQQRSIGLRTTAVGSGTSRHLVTAPGRVTPNETQYAYITPRASGVVRSVTAHLGQEVKAGDLLATIDSPVVGDARLDLYTRLQALEIATAQADWQATIFRNTLELIELLRKKESPQQIQELFAGKPVGENRERLLTAYAQYRLAEATMARNRDLYAQNLITSKQFQQVTAEYEVASATYQSLMDQMGFEVRLANTRAQQARKQAETAVRAAQERLRILGVKPDGTEPEVEHGKVMGVGPDGTLPALDSGAAPVSEKPETVLPEAKERGTVAVEPVGSPKENARSPADAPVSQYSIWAPFDGTILDREMIVPGVAVDATRRIFTLANLASVYVEASIHEQDFEALVRSQGGAIRFRSPAYPGRFFQGRVIYSGDLVEEASRTVKLLAKADNPERLLKPGMFVTVEILSPRESTTLHVPASAVLSQGDRSFVFVQSGPETFLRKDVELAAVRDDRALISHGLEPSDAVVVEGGFKLKAIAAQGSTAEP